MQLAKQTNKTNLLKVWENINYLSTEIWRESNCSIGTLCMFIVSEARPLEFQGKNKCNIEGFKMLTPLHHS